MRRDQRSTHRSHQSRNRGRGYSASRGSSRRRGRYEEESGSLWMPLIIALVVAVGLYIYSGRDWRMDLQTVKAMAEQYLPEQEEEAQTLPTYRAPCTQANIARIIAYTFFDEIPKATEPGEIWYKKYYAALAKDPKFTFFKEENAQKSLTYEETSTVLSDLLGTPGAVNLQGNDQIKTKPISLKTFIEGYENALSYAKMGEQITYETLGLVATPKTNGGLGQWKVLTDKGIYSFEGLVLDPFINMEVKAIIKGQEILGIIEAQGETVKIPQCYVTDVVDGQVQLKVGELELVYPNDILEPQDKDQVGTITLTAGKITAFEPTQKSDLDTVLRVGKDTIEFAKGGVLPYENIAVYDSTPKSKWSMLSQVSVGSQVSYGIEDGKVSTLNVSERSNPDQIRVLISKDGLGQYAHENVKISSKGKYHLEYNGTQIPLEAGKEWSAKGFDWKDGADKVVVVPGEEALSINSIQRQKVNPTYKGNLEIYREGDGSYTIINSLGMEDYVAAVVPSEMPPAYGIEAAKVQAICARSFAQVHQNNSKFAKYGAQVDDTTSTQVYNNVAANDISIQAAKETKGQALMYNGDVISGNFFSTSCGYSANFGETWANGEIFPTNTPIYLVARQQYIGDRVVKDLSQEKDAYAFFTLKPDEIDAFDDHSPWFRWQVSLSGKELSDMINSNVARLSSQSPNMVKVLSEEGKWETEAIDTLGTVTNMQVKKRGQGGNVMELMIEGSKNTIKVSTEYLIRTLLAPMQKNGDNAINIVRGDGTKVDNMTMLPSAFFSPDITYDNDNQLKEVTLYGGGFGHGVGMSQAGVKGMVDRGYTAKQILEHYYPEIQIAQN
ncbi:MAG: SpoIID/LytB domain-containing protein [Cellulosilyticaceae bacterium]